jgi:hypothetical protein
MKPSRSPSAITKNGDYATSDKTPCSPRASFSIKHHPAPSLVQENSLGRRARVWIGFFLDVRLLTRKGLQYPFGAPVPLWGSSTPLGLQILMPESNIGEALPKILD